MGVTFAEDPVEEQEAPVVTFDADTVVRKPRRRGCTFKEKHHLLFSEHAHEKRERHTVRQKNGQIKRLKAAVLQIKWGEDQGSHTRYHIRQRKPEKGEMIFDQGPGDIFTIRVAGNNFMGNPHLV